MKFAKYVFALLIASCMMPAVAGCKGGSCRRGNRGKAIIAKHVAKKAYTKCKGGSCRRGKAVVAKHVTKKACARCKSGYCKA